MATKIDLNNIDLSGITGKFKINKAQKDMLLAVTVTSFLLGVCVVLGIYFVKIVLFNQVVIREKKSAILGYSEAIQSIGICLKPSSVTNGYSDAELARCNPNTLFVDNLDENTLRYQVIKNLARDENLESVGRKGLSICVDSKTGEKLKYDELYKNYAGARTQAELDSAYELLTLCSALRTIPDALPSTKNELALMSSIDRIFREANWTPETITPGDVGEAEVNGMNLGTIGVSFSAEASTQKVVEILRKVETSIREFDLTSATVEYRSGKLNFESSGVAYYTGSSSLSEGVVTVRGNGTVNKTSSGSIVNVNTGN